MLKIKNTVLNTARNTQKISRKSEIFVKCPIVNELMYCYTAVALFGAVIALGKKQFFSLFVLVLREP